MGSISLPIACACLLVMPAPGLAQGETSAETAAVAPGPSPREAGARRDRRLYVGMWTSHLRHDPITLENNWAIGLSVGGFFGASFLNSFGRRAFAGGLQRTIVSGERPPFGASFGYRLGVVTGYDGRLLPIARKTPVLPLVQPFASIDVQRVGVEVSYTFVVVSVALSYKY